MPEQDPEPKNERKPAPERILLWVAVGIALISVLATLWLSGVFGPEPRKTPGYRNITFTDALVACEDKARATHGDSLQQLVVDDHSSRFDTRTDRYKIFFTATMASFNEESAVAEFYINCFVSTYRGRITSFEIYENKEDSTDAIRQDEGGIFGWPVN